MAFTVADSGGTGTSIAFYTSDSDIRYIETKALHPKFLLNWGPDEVAAMKAELPEDLSAPLYFYGAGCSRLDVAYEVKKKLVEIGFKDVTIFSDALGACRACCGKEEGVVAILGTGSVLLDYSGNEIRKITGGLGSIVGDEGSGFYFGKLVIKALFEEKLDDQTEMVTDLIGNQEIVRSQLAGRNPQEFIASIGAKLKEVALEELHRKNLELFLDLHLTNKTVSTLHAVGSYAWYQRKLLQELLTERGISMGIVLRNPVSQLVKFHALDG